MLASGAIKLMAAHACLTLSGYVTVVVLARGLGPEEYSVYAVVISVLLAVELIGRLGIPQAMSKLIAESDEPAPELEGTGITLTLVTYLSIFALFLLCSPFMARLFEIENGSFLFRLASIDIPIYGMFFICSHILNGRRRFGIESIGFVIYGVIKAVGILVLLYLGLSVAGALVINIIASAIGLAYLASRVPARSFRPTFRFARLVGRWAVPLALFLLGSQIVFSMHFWCLKILGQHVPDETVGLYAAAISVARLPNLIQFVMMALLVPSISHALAREEFERARGYVQGTVRFLGMLLLPTCCVIFLKSSEIMELFFSRAYLHGGPFLAILVLGTGLLYTLWMTFSAILIGGGYPRQAAGISLGLLPVGLVLSASLILRFGATGAAWSILLTSLAGTVASGYLVRLLVGPLIAPPVLLKLAVATALMSALAALVPMRGSVLIPGCVGLLACHALLLVLLGELKREDVNVLTHAGSRGASSR